MEEEIVVQSTKTPEEVVASFEDEGAKKELIQRLAAVKERFKNLEQTLQQRETLLEQKEKKLLEQDQALKDKYSSLLSTQAVISLDHIRNKIQLLQVIGAELRSNLSVLVGFPGASKNAELLVGVNEHFSKILDEIK